MATKFTKGQQVKLSAVVPSGPVKAFRMDEDGVVWCLLEWSVNGESVERWFREDDLTEA